MPVADKKKVQTMINKMGQNAQIIRDAIADMKAVRTAFQTHNPDVTGTPLDGNVTAVNNALNVLDTEINKAVWTGMIAAIVPSHRNKALD